LCIAPRALRTTVERRYVKLKTKLLETDSNEIDIKYKGIVMLSHYVGRPFKRFYDNCGKLNFVYFRLI